MTRELQRRIDFDERTTQEWCRMRERTPSAQALVQAVLGTSARLLEAGTIEELCRSALDMATDLLRLDVCRIAILDRGGLDAEVHTMDALGRSLTRIRRGDRGLTALALEVPELTTPSQRDVADRAHRTVDAAFLAPGVSTIALAPLFGANRRAVGAFSCATEDPDGFDDDELAIVRMFSLHLGSAIEMLRARMDLRHWNAIVHSSHAAILGKDLSGRITHWNPAAERLYGYAAREVLGRHVGVLVPEEKRGELKEIFARIGRGETTELETVRLTRRGRRIDVALTVSPIYNSAGQVIGASTIALDITEKKREQELFQQAVESSPSAMLLVGSDGRISLANAEAERLFGYSRDELARTCVEALLVGYEGIRDPACERSPSDARPESRARAGADLWARARDGTRIPVQVGLNTIRIGDRSMLLASIVDISERKKQELERQRLLIEARCAVAARDTFLSIASHELNTPLTALQLTVQGLLRANRKVPTPLPQHRVAEKLERMSRQVTRLGTLIDQLLDVSAITAGRLRLEPARADLDRLVREVVERFEHFEGTPPAYVGTDRPVFGAWDAGRLDQVLTNLVANAVKYGEGKPIEVLLDDLGDRVAISVHDEGPGIDPKDQARIFERFERLVSHRHFGGFGLGLWIVRQLVDAHHGQIEVESVQGKGSTFRVTLPKWHLDEEPLRVVIVEGDGVTASTLRAQLQSAEPTAEVELASSLEGTGDLIERFAPQILFVGASSYEAAAPMLQALSARRAQRPLMVVVMGGSARTRSRAPVTEAGAARFVKSPPTLENVRSVLAEYRHRTSKRSSVYRFGPRVKDAKGSG